MTPRHRIDGLVALWLALPLLLTAQGPLRGQAPGDDPASADLPAAPQNSPGSQPSPFRAMLWHTVTLSFAGPTTSETAADNPFTNYRLDVVFRHNDSGRRLVVPGFFAADGNAADSAADQGNVWQVRFNPDAIGRWEYTATLRHGDGIATIDVDQIDDAAIVPLAGSTGELMVEPSDKALPDFRSQGRLSVVGDRYLRFAGSGKWFLKNGCNSPETLLGYHDIDGTYLDTATHPVAAPHQAITLPSLDEGLHRFTPHVIDWRSGDPTWRDGKGKGLIGGINYLSQQGINSLYFVTMNVNGDGRNVWPWIGPWEHTRFDCSKLDQWERIFQHMNRCGLQLHVVLQETENDHLLDGGKLGPLRKLYFREMVSRFAHHNALQWNLGEECVQPVEVQHEMSRHLRDLDPYEHPIAIHNDHWSPRNLRDTFNPLVGKDVIDVTSLQAFNWNDIHAQTKHYVDASVAAGRPWVVAADEMGGADFGLLPDDQDPDHDDPRGKGLWGNLMAGGGGVEWYFGWQNNSPDSDLSAESWRSRQSMYRQSKIAIDFFQSYLPFHEMRSADHIGLAYADYGFAKPGDTYCIYLFSGGATTVDLQEHRGPFEVRWFDPRNGGDLQIGSIRHAFGPGWIDTGLPPGDVDRDWVVLIRRVDPVFAAGEDGAIAIEAEHFQEQHRDGDRSWVRHEKSGPLPDLPGAGDATTWVRSNLSAAKTASGSTFLRCLPDTKIDAGDREIPNQNVCDQPGQSAVLDYRVTIDHPGRYYVWVRSFSTGEHDARVHVGIDGTWPESARSLQAATDTHAWTWNATVGPADQPRGAGGPGDRVYLDIDRGGTHTISIGMHDDGFALDKVLLTGDRDYQPQAAGPPEQLP